MRGLILAAVGGLGLAGCAALKDPTLDDFANVCRAYGFQEGTPEMAQCVQSEVLAYRQGEAAANEAILARQPVRCRRTAYGTATCY